LPSSFDLFVLYLIEFLVVQHAYHRCDGVQSRGSSRDWWSQRCSYSTGPQDSAAVAAGGDGIPVPDTTTVAEVTASAVTSEVSTSDPTTSIGLAIGAPSSPPHIATATGSAGADDDVFEELEVIMCHPCDILPLSKDC
jgi:hypothetical protein